MFTLHVQLLSGFCLIYGGDSITRVSKRQQSLLAYLILHCGVPQPRQHLAFLFWPDGSESQAFTNLRNLLFQLRRTLPDAERFVQFDSKSVQWRSDSPFVLDVAEFEDAIRHAEEASGDEIRLEAALASAVSLYHGALLPTLYEDWVLAERARLQTLFAKTLEQLIDLAEGQRNYVQAIEHTNRLLDFDPLREDAYRRLMRLYALCHDRARALRAYADCTAVLQRELQI